MLREIKIGQDRDGDYVVHAAATTITHYHGDTVDTADLFTIDAPDPLDPAGLADHIAACRALLDFIDPTRVNRLPARSAAVSNDVRVEQLAQAALNDYGPEGVAAQLAAYRSGVWPARPDQVAVWKRAEVLAAGAA